MESVNQRQQQWIYAVIIGIINIIIGVLLVIFKRDSLNVILIISGVFLAIDGVIALFGGIQSKLVIPIVIGGVMLALGIALIILPNLFSDIFMVLLGILLILMGVTGALSVLDNDAASIPNIVFSAVIAVAMVVAGVFAIIYMDDAKDWVMILIGVLMIITGALNVGAGLLARQAVTQVKKL